jgi:hypothetical protein
MSSYSRGKEATVGAGDVVICAVNWSRRGGTVGIAGNTVGIPLNTIQFTLGIQAG